MSDLSAKIAHDLRGVLNSLHMVLKVMPPGPMVSLHEKALVEIEKGRSLADVVGAFVACQSPEPERCQLFDLWKSFQSQQAILCEGVKVTGELKNDYLVDRSLMAMMFTVVVDNARRAVLEAYDKVDDRSIEVTFEEKGEGAVVVVADKGKGFSATLMDAGPRLGESHWITPSYGYGLCLLESIVEAHGGEVVYGSGGSLSGAEVRISFPPLVEEEE